MINNKINKIPVTSGRPASIVKENLWNTVKEGDENPAGERVSSENITESKRRSGANVQIEKKRRTDRLG